MLNLVNYWNVMTTVCLALQVQISIKELRRCKEEAWNKRELKMEKYNLLELKKYEYNMIEDEITKTWAKTVRKTELKRKSYEGNRFGRDRLELLEWKYDLLPKEVRPGMSTWEKR